MKKAWWFLTNC